MLFLPFLGAVFPLFLSAPVIGDGGMTSCKPLSNVEPGRLNIAVMADDYGFIAPCKANVSFYIPKNTSLRSIKGMFRLSTSDGNNLSTEESFIDLIRTDHGMFAAEVTVSPVREKACRSLSVDLEIKSCQGDGGTLIECPEIRVKAPQGFAGLEVSGEKLNICYDD